MNSVKPVTMETCQGFLDELIMHERFGGTETPVTLLFVERARGGRAMAYCSSNLIEVTESWLLSRTYYIALAAIIHEFSHLVCYQLWGFSTHGREFVEIEDRLLKLYGFSIKRHEKVYATALYYGDEEVWHTSHKEVENV